MFAQVALWESIAQLPHCGHSEVLVESGAEFAAEVTSETETETAAFWPQLARNLEVRRLSPIATVPLMSRGFEKTERYVITLRIAVCSQVIVLHFWTSSLGTNDNFPNQMSNEKNLGRYYQQHATLPSKKIDETFWTRVSLFIKRSAWWFFSHRLVELYLLRLINNRKRTVFDDILEFEDGWRSTNKNSINSNFELKNDHTTQAKHGFTFSSHNTMRKLFFL